MCSRYTLTSPPEAVRSYFRYLNEAVFPPRYNIAPSQPVAIVRDTPTGSREMALVRWGLIPSWVKDPRAFKMLVNARSESAADKPSFRAAVRHKRCLVPSDGYYEWVGGAGAKRPHLIRPRGGGPMAMAGIYENWLGADGSEIETMAVLTTEANATTAVLHDRMPVVLQPEHFDVWLDCRPGTATHILDLMAPAPNDGLEIIEVSPKVNNPRNEGPEIQERVPTQATLL